MTTGLARAVRFDRYGDRECLVCGGRPFYPGQGEVVVESSPPGFNPGEAAIRSGAMHDMFPATFRPEKAATSPALWRR